MDRDKSKKGKDKKKGSLKEVWDQIWQTPASKAKQKRGGGRGMERLRDSFKKHNK